MRTFGVVLMMATLLPGEPAPVIRVHGHRGARTVRPENTIPAFEYAIRAGADLIELDVAVTRDNVVVVSHDPDLKAPICKGPEAVAVIRRSTLSQVRQWDCSGGKLPGFPRQVAVPGTRIPTLAEVFGLAPLGGFHFNVEIKLSKEHPELAPEPEEFARLVLAVIREHRMEARVMVQSFDFRVLHAMAKLAPEIPRAALYKGPEREFEEIAREAGTRMVAPHFSLVTPERVAAAHRAGLQVVPWTANDEATWDRLIAARVDGIISDDPEAVIAHLIARGARAAGGTHPPAR